MVEEQLDEGWVAQPASTVKRGPLVVGGVGEVHVKVRVTQERPNRGKVTVFGRGAKEEGRGGH